MAAVDSKVLPCARWISPQLLGNPSLRTSFLGDTAYYTCGVKRGKCYGVVMCPANESFVGKTAALVSGESKSDRNRAVSFFLPKVSPFRSPETSFITRGC